MRLVSALPHAIWRQRVYGGAGAFVFYLLLHFTGVLRLEGLTLTFQIGSFVLYVLAIFSSSPAWVRWTLAIADTLTLAVMIHFTGGANSPFLMIIPIWFFGVALANLADGQTHPIPWMLLLATLCGLAGTWQNLNLLTISIFAVMLFSIGTSAMTLALERRAGQRDPLLTHLFNRATGITKLEEMCKSSLAVTVAYIDLSDFKRINDQHGHKTGDEILLEVAKRLTASVRRSDLVVRMGGDEFLVASQQPDLQARLEQTFNTPMQTSVGLLTVLGDIGTVVVNPQQSVDAVLEQADARMYTRKRAAKAALA